MAIFHLGIEVISRGKGRSCIAAAAYRAAECLLDDRLGLHHDFSRKSGVLHTEIILPDHAPENLYNREEFWNEAERAESRADAQTAREINVALPTELSLADNLNMVREYISYNFVSQGMGADFSIHDTGRENPHAHIMLSMREITPSGFHTKKNREWNNAKNSEKWRESWALICNREFDRRGLETRIDHRSHERRGLEELPTLHLGVDANELEKKGIRTEIGDFNREVREYNRQLQELKLLEEQFAAQAEERKEIIRQLEQPDKITPRDGEEKTVSVEILKKGDIAPIPSGGELDYLIKKYAALNTATHDLAVYNTRIGALNHQYASASIFAVDEKLRIVIKVKEAEWQREQLEKRLYKDYRIRVEDLPDELKELRRTARVLAPDVLEMMTREDAAKASPETSSPPKIAAPAPTSLKAATPSSSASSKAATAPASSKAATTPAPVTPKITPTLSPVSPKVAATSPPPPAAKPGLSLPELKAEYVRLEITINRHEQHASGLKSAIHRLTSESHDLRHRHDMINDYATQIERLGAGRKELAGQLEQSKQQVIHGMWQDYGLRPDEALAKAREFDRQAQEKQRQYDSLPDISADKGRQQELGQQYQQELKANPELAAGLATENLAAQPPEKDQLEKMATVEAQMRLKTMAKEQVREQRKGTNQRTRQRKIQRI